jgi:hypothetical protein
MAISSATLQGRFKTLIVSKNQTLELVLNSQIPVYFQIFTWESAMSTSAHYATSLSDEQWHVLQLLLPEPKWQPGGPGRPPLNLRRVVDGIFYINKTACQ